MAGALRAALVSFALCSVLSRSEEAEERTVLCDGYFCREEPRCPTRPACSVHSDPSFRFHHAGRDGKDNVFSRVVNAVKSLAGGAQPAGAPDEEHGVAVSSTDEAPAPPLEGSAAVGEWRGLSPGEEDDRVPEDLGTADTWDASSRPLSAAPKVEGSSERPRPKGTIHAPREDLSESHETHAPDEEEEEEEVADKPARARFNYAGEEAGAVVLKASSGAQGASHLLRGDRDRYFLVPCDVKSKWFVVGLSEDVRAPPFPRRPRRRPDTGHPAVLAPPAPDPHAVDRAREL